nr:MAG TPA: hypothetical protein [Caudoviricetes sp.]
MTETLPVNTESLHKVVYKMLIFNRLLILYNHLYNIL